MDFSILYAIQGIHTPVLDSFILAITKIMGSYGQIWLVVGVVLCLFKKTRRCGAAVLISYGLVYLVGQYGLKDLIARPRPCQIDRTVDLLVKRPSSYSCPSTHSAWAFAAATSIFLYYRKAGIAVFAAAVLIGFSRLYLFVHFPTDVLFGAVMGMVLAYITVRVQRACLNKLADRAAQKK